MMDQVIREEYFITVDNLYSGLKNSGIPNYLELAMENARKKFPQLSKSEMEGLELEVYSKYQSTFSVPKPSTMHDGNNIPWFSDRNPTYSYFWPRYEEFLLDHKNWSLKTVTTIDKTTNEILKSLGNPKLPTPFNKRGLVLGHVQSGKTANFTGLINKAFDVGYTLVIVLAGMHNDLRAQTQLRLRKEVVGINEMTSEITGVGEVRNDGKVIETWTTVENDISTSNAIGLKNLDKQILLVVKKQKDVLPKLIDLLGNSLKHSKTSPPVLIIDDEADQASVDASGGDTDPTKINQGIRELLNLFERKAYVGYTATPFANLLIRADANHVNLKEDLYPKDFVVALPKPDDYCGPDEFFNTTGYEEDNKPMFIRNLSEEDVHLLDKLRTKSDSDLFTEVPETMQEAILAFLIATAVRNLRGQTAQHNSMLIHTSRLTDVQNSMCWVIKKFYKELANEIMYNCNSAYVTQLQVIYENDFIEVQRSFEQQNNYEVFTWEKVYKTIKIIAGKVEVMEINGESDDALEYDRYIEQGLNVIAVGGNKLSRGLTLEGLTISYYYRNSTMYDTLMQMGRWFGFRTGYMDLCRIYTTDEIAKNFEHLAVVMSEVREEFEKLAREGLTPDEYAIKMLTHEKMTVTSPKKMLNATTVVSYTGTMQQTRSFEKTKDFYETNMDATVEFINSVKEEFEPYKTGANNKNGTKYHIARNVPSEQVISYLQKYKTVSSARIVNSKKIANYIQGMNESGALKKFNIAVVDVTETTLRSEEAIRNNIKPWHVKLGKILIDSAVLRSIDMVKETLGVVDLGAIVAANQEFIDIPNRVKSKKDNIMLRKDNSPLLLIYPLHPQVKPFRKLNIDFTEDLVPIGLAFSFPDLEFIKGENGELIRFEEKDGYITNKTIGGGKNND